MQDSVLLKNLSAEPRIARRGEGGGTGTAAKMCLFLLDCTRSVAIWLASDDVVDAVKSKTSLPYVRPCEATSGCLTDLGPLNPTGAKPPTSRFI